MKQVMTFLSKLQPISTEDRKNDIISTKRILKRREEDTFPCKLIHQVSSGVCVQAGLRDYPTKKGK